MRSMTGYGSSRGTATDGTPCAVEIQSVNRRQAELLVNLPRDLASLEPHVREIINGQIARGRLVVNITLQGRPAGKDADVPAAALDVATARAYYRAMLALREELGAGGEITIETVLRAPGVLRLSEETIAPDAARPAVEAALRQALGELVAMRTREGHHLAEDLRTRLAEMRMRLADIRRRQPDATANYRLALHERLAKAGVDVPIDDDRLAKEIVLFADRCDISEEVTRLESHLDQFGALLPKDEPVGRALDFLTQEMARELNTLGAKSNDLAINQLALVCKTELDKVREQVQNIE
jgi:uncharacterized protein (TIGR00255 family)